MSDFSSRITEPCATSPNTNTYRNTSTDRPKCRVGTLHLRAPFSNGAPQPAADPLHLPPSTHSHTHTHEWFAATQLHRGVSPYGRRWSTLRYAFGARNLRTSSAMGLARFRTPCPVILLGNKKLFVYVIARALAALLWRAVTLCGKVGQARAEFGEF